MFFNHWKSPLFVLLSLFCYLPLFNSLGRCLRISFCWYISFLGKAPIRKSAFDSQGCTFPGLFSELYHINNAHSWLYMKWICELQSCSKECAIIDVLQQSFDKGDGIQGKCKIQGCEMFKTSLRFLLDHQATNPRLLTNNEFLYILAHIISAIATRCNLVNNGNCYFWKTQFFLFFNIVQC